MFILCREWLLALQEGVRMRAVIQLSDKKSISIEDIIIEETANGLSAFWSVSKEDIEQDMKCLVDKIVNLRIFSDAAGKMNLSLSDDKGELLVLLQFTLYMVDISHKGRRLEFDAATQIEVEK